MFSCIFSSFFLMSNGKSFIYGISLFLFLKEITNGKISIIFTTHQRLTCFSFPSLNLNACCFHLFFPLSSFILSSFSFSFSSSVLMLFQSHFDSTENKIVFHIYLVGGIYGCDRKLCRYIKIVEILFLAAFSILILERESVLTVLYPFLIEIVTLNNILMLFLFESFSLLFGNLFFHFVFYLIALCRFYLKSSRAYTHTHTQTHAFHERNATKHN